MFKTFLRLHKKNLKEMSHPAAASTTASTENNKNSVVKHKGGSENNNNKIIVDPSESRLTRQDVVLINANANSMNERRYLHFCLTCGLFWLRKLFCMACFVCAVILY